MIGDSLPLDIDSLPKDNEWSYRFSEGKVTLKRGGKFTVEVSLLVYCESHVLSLCLLVNDQKFLLSRECAFTNYGDNFSLFYGNFSTVVDSSVRFVLSRTSDTGDALVNSLPVHGDYPRAEVTISEMMSAQ